MKRILAILTVAAFAVLPATAKKDKTKYIPGPYRFTTQASVHTAKEAIIRSRTSEGWDMETDSEFQLRFKKERKVPFMAELLTVPSGCTGLQSFTVATFTLTGRSTGGTDIVLQTAWEHPGDLCKMQTQPINGLSVDEVALMQSNYDALTDPRAQQGTQKATAEEP